MSLCLTTFIKRIFGSNGNTTSIRYDMKLEVHKVNYIWVIHDYDFHKAKLTKGESIKSPVFHASTEPRCKWNLTFYPYGRKNHSDEGTLLRLHFHSTSECKEVFAKYKFFILKQNKVVWKAGNEKVIHKFGESTDNGGGRSCGYCISVPLPANKKPLTIKCEVTFTLANPITKTIKPPANVANFRLHDDFRKLFENQESADVVLSVKDKKYGAHKLVLIARSPVFATMFKHGNMIESLLNKVEITDLDEQVVEAMLEYIYTDELQNLEKFADGLLAAAEKYGLGGLKQLSQDALISRLSVKNSIDMLILSDLYQAPVMKSSAINYIIEKSAVVMKTKAWMNLGSTHPHLIVEVCNAVTEELHRSSRNSSEKK